MYDRQIFLPLSLLLLCVATSHTAASFRVTPYLQNPAPDAMTLIWFSETGKPGDLRFHPVEGAQERQLQVPGHAITACGDDRTTSIPYRHTLRIDGLKPDTRYDYTVTQGTAQSGGRFRTAPTAQMRRPMRFVFYSDSETEPESTGKPAGWSDPSKQVKHRKYLVDQTVGYALNLREIKAQQPDLILIPGDVVQTGGRQLDWDEFWKHNSTLAASVPIIPTLGNHDYEGDRLSGWHKTTNAFAKWQAYWAPSTKGVDPWYHKRYFRLDYGPVTFLALDTNNGDDADPTRDTNLRMSARESGAPDFNPGSPQWKWLEAQLRDTQKHSTFTFVYFHHTPWSSGPHARPPVGEHDDDLSVQPARVLIPLLQRYGVDAVMCGHDEMYERSVIAGKEQLPDGSTRSYDLLLYDVGFGGDGLRGPKPYTDNPYRVFLAHVDAPEVWRNGRIISGGKHYGHLTVDVVPTANGWITTLTPVYLIPRLDNNGKPTMQYDRHTYDDIVKLHANE